MVGEEGDWEATSRLGRCRDTQWVALLPGTICMRLWLIFDRYHADRHYSPHHAHMGTSKVQLIFVARVSRRSLLHMWSCGLWGENKSYNSVAEGSKDSGIRRIYC